MPLPDAAELQEDLRRQLHHLPLRYAAEPSFGERGRKWLRRNARLRSPGQIATAVLTMCLWLRLGVLGREYRHLRAETFRFDEIAGRDLSESHTLGAPLPAHAEEYLERGRDCLARGDLDGAVAHCTSALALEPYLAPRTGLVPMPIVPGGKLIGSSPI